LDWFKTPKSNDIVHDKIALTSEATTSSRSLWPTLISDEKFVGFLLPCRVLECTKMKCRTQEVLICNCNFVTEDKLRNKKMKRHTGQNLAGSWTQNSVPSLCGIKTPHPFSHIDVHSQQSPMRLISRVLIGISSCR
jgi:hypothetical protein